MINIGQAIGSTLSAIVSPVANYFTERQKIKAEDKARESRIKEAKTLKTLEMISQGKAVEADYDNKVLDARRNTLMDEFLSLWMLGIVTCLFIPDLATYAQIGFINLSKTPIFFQLCFVGVFISTLGLRFLFTGRQLLGKVVK